MNGSRGRKIRKADDSPEAEYLKAKAYALKLLSYRSRSRKEIVEKLGKKGFSQGETERVISYLKNTEFIKDETLARQILRTALERKNLGRQGIKMLLSKRGIEKDLIKETLSGLTDEEEQDAALRLAEKKLKNLKGQQKNTIKQKLWRALQRKGFPADIINSVLKSINL
ncbi:MAG: regulatory protein RecX [Nitrospirae bacterium]|nr:regulatory protein RecX [Nitrospirota bacterium]